MLISQKQIMHKQDCPRHTWWVCDYPKNHTMRIMWALLWTVSISVCQGCHFPSSLTGLWNQKGWQTGIRIEGSTFSIKGTCVASNANQFLVEDSKEKCFRCILILDKHPNVLQYRETYCEPHRTLEEACKGLSVDAHLHTMFRVDSRPVACPFRGPFTFTYSRDHGLFCSQPLSNVDTCTDDSQLLFRFQACADVPGTESSEVELTCLATWKEGSTHYLVGKMKPRKRYILPHAEETYYRCFVYEKGKDGFDVSQSADATCDGLISTRDGSPVMKLHKGKHPTSGCQFPSWVTSTHKWHTLDGRLTYVFSHKNTSYKIVHLHSDHPDSKVKIGHSHNDHADTKVMCTEEVASTPNSTTVVAHSMQGCSNGFVCLTFHQRDKHIIEIQTGEFFRRPHDACSSPRYDAGGVEYVTLVASATAVTPLCPQLAETNGLRITGSRDRLLSELCPDSVASVVGCRSQDTLEFLITCDAARTHLTFQCQGLWEENGRSYLIAGLRGSKTKYCFVYSSSGKVTHFSGLPDKCPRSINPDVTGHLTFNITSAEKNMADFVSTKSRDLLCRLQLNTGFLQECPSTLENNISFLDAKRTVNTLKAVNDSAERAVKLMQDFHGLLTVDEEQKQFVLRCVQDHRKLYTNCKKETLKRKYSQ